MYEIEIVIAISAVLAGWYFVGSYQNRKLTSRAWTAVLEQTERFASRMTVRELGGSAFIAVAEGIRPPFKRLEMAYTSLPREILINYLISKAMGRRDLLTVVGDFTSTPKTEKRLSDIPDLVGRVLKLEISPSRPNLRIIMSLEQLLSNSLEDSLSSVAQLCRSGMC